MMKKMKGKSEMIDRMIQDMDDSDIQFKQLVKENTDKPLSELEDLFPCAIMMCGSGFAFSVVRFTIYYPYIRCQILQFVKGGILIIVSMCNKL